MKKTFIKTFPERRYCWLIPSAVDQHLKKMLQQHPPQFRRKLKKDYFYQIIDTICQLMDYLDPKEEHWVRLNAEKLKAFNDNYTEYLSYLEKSGIIRISASYLPGQHCRGYQINPWLLEEEPIEVPVSDFVIRRKLRAEQQRKIKKSRNNPDQYLHLSKWFNGELAIDAKGARKAALSLYGNLEKNAKNEKQRFKAIRGRHKTLRAIKRLENRDYHHHRDDNIGRFHTLITNLKREIRCFITYGGQTLVNCDIKNAQLLFLGTTLSPAFYRSEAPLSILSLKSLEMIKNDKKVKRLLSSIYSMLPVSPESEAGREFERFLHSVQTGKFYEELFQLTYPGRVFTSQGKMQIKIMAFRILFSDNRKLPKYRQIEKPFRDAYPTVYKVLSLLKRHNKRVLSNILQRIEAFIIVENVTRRIARERPELTILTVHDSVVTTLGNEDYVMAVMKEEMSRIIGLQAAIGKEYWTPFSLSTPECETDEQCATTRFISQGSASGKAA